MWLVPWEMEPPVIKLGQVWTKIILKIENVRAWKPFSIVFDYENDSTRGLPYQDRVHQALNICPLLSSRLMNLVRTHSVKWEINKNVCSFNHSKSKWYLLTLAPFNLLFISLAGFCSRALLVHGCFNLHQYNTRAWLLAFKWLIVIEYVLIYIHSLWSNLVA